MTAAPAERPPAVRFILVCVLLDVLDVLGFGLVIPVLPSTASLVVAVFHFRRRPVDTPPPRAARFEASPSPS